MKKLICFLIIFSMAITTNVFARDSYIILSPYPFSTHVLGEDLVIYGNTDFSQVTLGLFYPNDEQGYFGYAKYIATITAQELRQGHVIKTDTTSRLWPKGNWTVAVQYGDVRDEIIIPMSDNANYNRCVRVAQYEDLALVSLDTYKCRGVIIRNGVFGFTTDEGKNIRIFSWDNFSPSTKGDARIFIASYTDEGIVENVQTFYGTVSLDGLHFTLNISDTERVEIFVWEDGITPVN
ncbi:MAG: hypothetical protein IJ297_06500 [Clostridia bacterium]|nr:hypothetical protein [Clostridia bacterium]